jgi:hypothetical protein
LLLAACIEWGEMRVADLSSQAHLGAGRPSLAQIGLKLAQIGRKLAKSEKPLEGLGRYARQLSGAVRRQRMRGSIQISTIDFRHRAGDDPAL